MRRVPIIFGVVLAGVTVASAQQGDVKNYEGGSTEAAQSQVPPVPPPDPYPCHFGPIIKRINQNDMTEIILDSPTLGAAWYAILARPEDEEAEPLGFKINAPDDGLGDWLVCPDESSQ